MPVTETSLVPLTANEQSLTKSSRWAEVAASAGRGCLLAAASVQVGLAGWARPHLQKCLCYNC